MRRSVLRGRGAAVAFHPRRRSAAVALVLLAACTTAPVAVRTPSPSPIESSVSPSPSPSPSPTPSEKPKVVKTFSFDNVMGTIRTLATEIGPREAITPAFRRAVTFIRSELRDAGYNARVLRVPVPAGAVNRVPRPAGVTYDVIGEPPGYNPRKPHVIVCGHLDTVPYAPGANDNASGVAVALELARLSRANKLKIPVVFVAFGAEESRVQQRGVLPPKYGSAAYVKSLSAAERRSVVAVLNYDMVGAGSLVHIGDHGVVVNTAFRTARRLGILVQLHVSKLSDHTSFQDADLPVVWFWSGGHPSLHKPWDTPVVIQRAEVMRMGNLGWTMLRDYASDAR